MVSTLSGGMQLSRWIGHLVRLIRRLGFRKWLDKRPTPAPVVGLDQGNLIDGASDPGAYEERISRRFRIISFCQTFCEIPLANCSISETASTTTESDEL